MDRSYESKFRQQLREGTLLKEAASGTLEFTSRLGRMDVSIWAEEEGVDTDPGDFLIKWSVEFETREYGIKSTIVSIQAIEGVYEIMEEDDQWQDRDFEFSPTGTSKDDFQVDDSAVEFNNGTLSINQLEIDFKRKQITVS